MYLHIGHDNIILEKNIIGIFNIDSLKENKIYEKLINKLENEKKVIKIIKNDNEEKTLILVEEDKIIKGYISDISSITLANRNLK